MSTYKNLISLGAAAVFALGLAACSSSGSDTQTGNGDNGDNGDTKLPPVTSACPGKDAASHAACVEEKKMAMDEAKEALDAAKADQSSTQAQIAAAQDAYDAAVTAHAAAVTAQNTYADMQPPMYDLKAMAKAVGTPGDFGSSHAGSAVDGGMVKVDDGEGGNEYSKATWPVPTIADWAGSVWEKDDAAAKTKDSIVVYTNVQAKKSGKYTEYYVRNASTVPTTGMAKGFSWAAWPTVVESVADADTGLLNLDEANVGANYKHFSAAALPTGSLASQNYADVDTTTTVDERKFKGTFQGVAGTFACDGTTCTATNDRKGNLASLTGGQWTFTPDSTKVSVADVQTDADYLDFGYWVQTTAAESGTAYTVDAFYLGQADSDDVSALNGSATYKGAAAGLYVKRALSAGGDGAVEAAGRFTADAELTAYFGGDSVSTNNADSISGTIKNFMDGGNVIDASWSLELMKIGGATGAGGVGTFTAGGSATEHFTGGNTTGGGNWSGNFYGPVATNTTPHTLPSGVAGDFTGGWNNGSVVGSFGATKTAK